MDKDALGLKRYADESEEPKDEEEPSQKIYEQREREGMKNFIPGAIYEVAVDNTHPLGFGIARKSYTLKRSSSRYALMAGWLECWCDELWQACNRFCRFQNPGCP